MSYGAILIMPSLLSAGRTWALAEASEGKKHTFITISMTNSNKWSTVHKDRKKSPLSYGSR
jgi:hypothetical protein